jgi:hypothetical protein
VDDAYRRTPEDDNFIAQVLIPPVLARIKQPDERTAFPVKSTQVRPIVGIAVVTGETQVSAFVSSAFGFLFLCIRGQKPQTRARSGGYARSGGIKRIFSN